MKTNISVFIAFITGITFMAIIGWNNTSTKKNFSNNNHINSPDSRPMIALRKLKLKPNVSAEEFEKFAVKVANGEYGKIPGVKEFIAKGERGDEIGNYIYVIEFDSKTSRDFYFPVPGTDTSKTSAEALKFLNSLTDQTEFAKMADIVPTDQSYTDYVVLK